MKYLLIFIGIILIIITAFLLLVFSPYFIYFQAINQGLSSSYLTMNSQGPQMLRPIEFKLKKIDEFFPQNERRWKSFHFADYKVSLPLQHPTLVLLPLIVQEKGKTYFGGDIIDGKNISKFKFVAGGKFDVDYHLESQKLFDLPIFKEDLGRIPKNKFFKILFTHDVRLKNIDKKTKLSYLRSLWKIPYSDLIFNLFVLNARNKVFSKKMAGFTFNPEKEVGVIETEDDNPNYYNETLFFLDDEEVYTFKYRVQKGDLMADAIRTRALKILQLQKSYEDKRIEAYNDFRNLSYKDKISSVGFTYLYAGFTHVPQDLIYYKAMIRDLEKRPDNARFLTPLYEYGEKVLKIEKEKEKETKVKKEKDKPEGLNAEEKAIIKQATKEVENVDQEDQLSKEEKVDFYLEDAKKEGPDMESEDGVLEMD